MPIKISAQHVKELRIKTGAGMMTCKKALQESSGNMEQAIKNLRKKGLTSAGKKSSRHTSEGVIDSYIHAGSRIGVMIELNCETDFVARRVEFQELSKNIAMQIAACPSVEYISIEQIPESVISLETKIESEKEDLVNKSEDLKNQIVKGRIQKRLKEMTLLNQNFIRNQDITIQDLINHNITLTGESIKITRFTRFLLGEGKQKKINNFAKEVQDMMKS